MPAISRITSRSAERPARGRRPGGLPIHADRSRLVLDLAAVRANVGTLRARLDGGDLWAVVKADGYGHGAVPVGGAALEAGAAGLAVATLREAERLRAAHPVARIMVMSPLEPGEERRAGGYELVVSTPEGWDRVRGLPDVRLHVKVDTGMGRWGLDPEAALEVGRTLVAERQPRLAGLMSHLATAEDPDTRYAEAQIERFREVASVFPPCPRHLANSAGTLRLPDARFDGGRCGIALYGVAPDDGDPARDSLVPALSWTSRVAAVRRLEPGESSGYGRRLVAEVPSRVAIVPVGYADGYPRILSGRSDVLIRGRRCPVQATVSMDALAATIPDGLEVEVGDVVTLLGRDGGERIGAEELGRLAGTIGYEIVCRLRTRPDRDRREAVSAGS